MDGKKERIYIAIDLKSFYASVECIERHMDPLTTNLVVADESRTEKTICLAVSPSLKAHKIPGRARLFEVIQRVKEINRERMNAGIKSGAIQRNPETHQYEFSSSSFNAEALEADPTLELTYVIAPPRMRLYEEYSSRIYGIYLKYIDASDIVVYSIDEVFMDVTAYLSMYSMTPHELAMTMIREVLFTTGITATAGIGTNLFLAKVAMDIVAKHVPADKDGVRIADLDEMKFRKLLWTHRPLKDFWRIGPGISAKLEDMQLFTLGDVARASLNPLMENRLYKVFGINAELIIDHAWGWEPTTVDVIKSYRPSTKSMSSGQVLHLSGVSKKNKALDDSFPFPIMFLSNLSAVSLFIFFLNELVDGILIHVVIAIPQVQAYEVLSPMKHIIPITYTVSCLCQPFLIPFEKSFQWDALLRKQWNG